MFPVFVSVVIFDIKNTTQHYNHVFKEYQFDIVLSRIELKIIFMEFHMTYIEK